MKKNIQKNRKLIIAAIFVLSLLTISFSNIYAQKKDFQFRQGKIFESNVTSVEYLGETADFTYFKCMERYDAYIEKIDKKLGLVKRVEVTLEYMKDELDYIDLLMIDETIYVFGAKNEKKLQKKVLYVTTIDNNSLLTSKDWKKVGESKYIDDDYHGEFFIKKSENEKFVLIGSNQMFKENVIRHIHFSVFNEKMVNQYEGLFELPFNFEEIGIRLLIMRKVGITKEHLAISNDGSIYLFSYINIDNLSGKDIKKGMIQTKLNNGYYLFKFNEEDKTVTPLEITFEKHFPLNAILKFDNENNPVIAGFYTRESPFSMHGAFYVKVDKNEHQYLKNEFSEFSNEFILMGNKPDEKDKKNMKNDGYLSEAACQLRNIHITPSGKIIVVGEFYATYAIGAGQNRTTYYIYGDVFIVQFDTQANTSNTSRIIKRSDTSKNGPFGILSVYSNDNLYVFFNDAISNDNLRNPKDNSVCGLFTKLSVVMVKVNAEGKISRNKLTDSERNKTLMLPTFIHEKNGKILLNFEDGSDRNLAEVAF